jgi:hypothetical protein
MSDTRYDATVYFGHYSTTVLVATDFDRVSGKFMASRLPRILNSTHADIIRQLKEEMISYAPGRIAWFDPENMLGPTQLPVRVYVVYSIGSGRGLEKVSMEAEDVDEVWHDTHYESRNYTPETPIIMGNIDHLNALACVGISMPRNTYKIETKAKLYTDAGVVRSVYNSLERIIALLE